MTNDLNANLHNNDEERSWPIPPKQQPYVQALELAFDALNAIKPSVQKLESLGARLDSTVIRLQLFDQEVVVDINKREVTLSTGRSVRIAWALLVLHYLTANDVSINPQEVSLAHFTDNRGYLEVFGKRIVNRFLKTIGITSERFIQVSNSHMGTLIPSTGLCYKFDLLPRVPIAIIRHDGDDEFGPGANVIYRADIENLLPAEDRIVAVELLLNTLSGASIDED